MNVINNIKFLFENKHNQSGSVIIAVNNLLLLITL